MKDESLPTPNIIARDAEELEELRGEAKEVMQKAMEDLRPLSLSDIRQIRDNIWNARAKAEREMQNAEWEARSYPQGVFAETADAHKRVHRRIQKKATDARARFYTLHWRWQVAEDLLRRLTDGTLSVQELHNPSAEIPTPEPAIERMLRILDVPQRMEYYVETVRGSQELTWEETWDALKQDCESVGLNVEKVHGSPDSLKSSYYNWKRRQNT